MHVADGQAVARDGATIDGDLNLRLAQQQIGAHIGRAGNRSDNIDNPVRVGLKFFRIVSKQLDGQFAFHARNGFVDVVLDVLAELRVDARDFLQIARHRVAQFVAGMGGLPLFARDQADAVFGDVPAVDVGAVVGPAQLADDVADFGKGSQAAADVLRDLG